MRYIKLFIRDMSLYKADFTQWLNTLYVAQFGYLSLYK